MIFSVILTSLRSLIHVFDLHKRDFFKLPDGKILAEKKNVAARNQDRSSAAGLQHFFSSKKRLPRSKKYAFKDLIFSEFFFFISLI